MIYGDISQARVAESKKRKKEKKPFGHPELDSKNVCFVPSTLSAWMLACGTGPDTGSGLRFGSGWGRIGLPMY